jgi:hypothetical protein
MLDDEDDNERELLTIHYDYETGEITRIEDHLLYTQSIAGHVTKIDLHQDALHMLGERCNQSVRDFLSKGDKQVKGRKAGRKK